MDKIIIIGPTPPPYFGVSTATRIILDNMNTRFKLFHLDTSDRRESLNFGIIDLYNIYLAIKHLIQLFFLHLRYRPHLTYIPISQGAPGYLRDAFFILISKLFKSKIVLHLRGGKHFKTFYSNANPLIHQLIKITIPLADRVIVLGESLKSNFTGLTDKNKIVVVPNGVNPDDFYVAQLSQRNGSPIQMCFLSNLISTKGYFETLQAVCQLSDKYDLRLVLAGHWDNKIERDRTTKFIDDNNLKHKIKYVGVVSGENKKKLLAESDIFLLPTYYPNEGQPWSILEAMASGLPVITTDQGCITESVIDGLTGYIVSKKNVSHLAEILEKLILDNALRIKMGKNGREKIINELNEENFINKLAFIFREVILDTQQ